MGCAVSAFYRSAVSRCAVAVITPDMVLPDAAFSPLHVGVAGTWHLPGCLMRDRFRCWMSIIRRRSGSTLCNSSLWVCVSTGGSRTCTFTAPPTTRWLYTVAVYIYACQTVRTLLFFHTRSTAIGHHRAFPTAAHRALRSFSLRIVPLRWVYTWFHASAAYAGRLRMHRASLDFRLCRPFAMYHDLYPARRPLNSSDQQRIWVPPCSRTSFATAPALIPPFVVCVLPRSPEQV